MTSSCHGMFTAPREGGCCCGRCIVASDRAQEDQVTFPKSHSHGRARAQTQRRQAPELLAWKRTEWGEAGVTRHQRRLERWARSLTCSLPGATSVSQRLSLTPQTAKHPPWPVPGLFIKLHFAILTPSWPPCSQGERIARRGGMASRPQTIGSPDLQA